MHIRKKEVEHKYKQKCLSILIFILKNHEKYYNQGLYFFKRHYLPLKTSHFFKLVEASFFNDVQHARPLKMDSREH